MIRMTLERAFEILDRFNRCEACDTSDTSFTCQDCDEAFYIALKALKEKQQKEAFYIALKALKEKQQKEAAEGVEKNEETGREPGALQEGADHAGRGEDGRGCETAGNQQDHGEPDQSGGV